MAELRGFDAVIAELGRREDDADEVEVVVGFTQAYAVHVHEDLEARHPVGQAKYLEQPARALARELGAVIGAGVKAGMPLSMAMLRAGLRLQREAQLLTPVDTGALRNSAFTELEKGSLEGG